MVEKHSDTIRSVAWAELFPWLSLLRVFRLAIAARMLVLAAAGVLLTAIGWALLATLLCPQICAVDQANPARTTLWLEPCAQCPWTAITKQSPQPTLKQIVTEPGMTPATYWQRGPIIDPWRFLTKPALSCLSRHTDFSRRDGVCLVLCGLWGVMVWAFFGAAICRTAAVRLAADEQIGLGSALRFAGRKWPAYFAAPLLPIGVIAAMAILIAILGWLMKWSFGLILGGLLWWLVLIAAFLMAVVLLGALFGWPLMWAAVSAEGTDSFDALSRSYAYVLQRPLRYLFYIAVATLLGWLGWLLVWGFSEGMIWLAYWAAGWGCGREQLDAIMTPGAAALSDTGAVGAGIIRFWVSCVRLLAVGFLFSYFWTASTAVYFLLRHDVDATEMDEVFLDSDATEPEPLESTDPVAQDEPPAAN